MVLLRRVNEVDEGCACRHLSTKPEAPQSSAPRQAKHRQKREECLKESSAPSSESRRRWRIRRRQQPEQQHALDRGIQPSAVAGGDPERASRRMSKQLNSSEEGVRQTRKRLKW